MEKVRKGEGGREGRDTPERWVQNGLMALCRELLVLPHLTGQVDRWAKSLRKTEIKRRGHWSRKFWNGGDGGGKAP